MKNFTFLIIFFSFFSLSQVNYTSAELIEKSEIELSIARHQYEELQQKHEVMEEVYMKLKQDLTKMMDRYSKLEFEYEKLQQKLRQKDQYLIDQDNRD